MCDCFAVVISVGCYRSFHLFVCYCHYFLAEIIIILLCSLNSDVNKTVLSETKTKTFPGKRHNDSYEILNEWYKTNYQCMHYASVVY